MDLFRVSKLPPVDCAVRTTYVPKFTKRFTVDLNVHNFFFFECGNWTNDPILKSELVEIGGTWSLWLSPNSATSAAFSTVHRKYVHLVLVLDREVPVAADQTIEVTCTVKIPTYLKLVTHRKRFRGSDTSINMSEFVSHADLFDTNHRHLFDKCLTIHADVTLRGPPVLASPDQIQTQSGSEKTTPNAIRFGGTASDLAADLADLLHSKSDTDFTVVSSDDVELAVHRLILSMRSEVFRAMLKPSTTEGQTGRCTISDIDGEPLKVLVQHIYTGSVECQPDLAEKVLIAADKYGMLSLVDSCLTRITENITHQNALRILRFAEKYHLRALTDAVCRVIGMASENDE